MKIVILADVSTNVFNEIVALIGGKESTILDTQNCDKNREYDYLVKNINDFDHFHKKRVMLIKFSGRKSIVRDLGGDCPQMIIPLSDKKNSEYYIENIMNTFVELLKIEK